MVIMGTNTDIPCSGPVAQKDVSGLGRMNMTQETEIYVGSPRAISVDSTMVLEALASMSSHCLIASNRLRQTTILRSQDGVAYMHEACAF